MKDPSERSRAEALEEKLAALRVVYRRALPEQLEALAEALAAAARPGAADAVEKAWQLAHRLKGTSGSYGFTELAEWLEVIEEILERARRSSSPPADDEQARAMAALKHARALLA